MEQAKTDAAERTSTMDDLDSLDDLEEHDGNRTLALAAVVGSAVVAGAVAFLVRRGRQAPPPPPPVAAAAAAAGAWDRARGMAFGDERAQATRDFFMEKVLPEFKPAMLGILEEVEDLVNDGFRRAEKAIKAM